MSVLLINASIRGDESISRSLSHKLAQQLVQPGKNLVERDLTKEDLPFVSASRFAANGTAKEERSEEQEILAELADQLIAELIEADTVIIGAPIYNFGPPASLKAWADLVARAGTTFQYGANGPEGLLTGKKAYILGVSGGTPIGSDIDFMSPWLKFFLGFLGITDVHMIAADGIMGQDGEEKIQAAFHAIEKLVA